MITHHQGAITMAQNEIKDGQFPDAIALSKSIISGQQRDRHHEPDPQLAVSAAERRSRWSR